MNGVDCTPANEAAEIANAVQRNDFPTDELYAFAVMNKSLVSIFLSFFSWYFYMSEIIIL